MAVELPKAAAFKRRVIALSFWVSLPGLAIILAFLLSLLDMTGAQWSWFFWATAVIAVVITPPMMMLQARILAPIASYLDRSGAAASEEVDATAQLAAFAVVLDLPRKLALVASGGWLVPCIGVGLAMIAKFENFGAAEFGVIALAGTAAAFVSGSFMLYLVKRQVEPVRGALARDIADPEARQERVRSIPLRFKILACVTGLTTVSTVFAAALFLAKASDALEDFTVRWQHGVLDAVQGRMHGGSDVAQAVSQIVGSGETLAVPLDVMRLDLGKDQGEDAVDFVQVLRDEIRRQHAAGRTRGSSVGLPSDRIFAWRALGDGSILLAVTPGDAVQLDSVQMWIAVALLLGIATAVGFALAWLIAADVSGATAALRREAERMASGDLRRGRVFESEDELGELSRSFEAMATSLRFTVSRVASAADRVESTAAEIASVSQSVAAVTAGQVSGIQQASTSMEGINAQVRGIADLSQALNASVEESSSSILELGASGQDLNDTATTLSAKVEEVSSSIEQMVRSVSQVAGNTESLGEASEETSSSMEEMANSLREVDATAEEAAELSRQVVSSAEMGQAKVRQTIDGMDAIRVATETAEQVIRNLGGRTNEIGAIVDVIDDVADETNLLALNAAIIAAQAGDQGRAFSVVADEIKDLADRVLASTKEIGGLIRAVQEEGANAIGAIERGTQSVASGVDLSAEAGVSLEEITRASRESGTRMQGIVSAVREQARAASHVVELMERVRGGVEEIRSAATEQERGNRVVYQGATTMREVAEQVRGTTEEQARGSGRIRESAEEVRVAVDQISTALQEQSTACRSAVEFLEEVFARTRSNEESARRMDDATQGLQREAAELREDVHRFRI